jgi:hypothetical protein
MKLATPAIAAVGCVAIAGCAGSGKKADDGAKLPAPGPFFANEQTVRTTLTDHGVGVSSIVPGAAPESVLPQPARIYKLRTRGGTAAKLLVYGSPNKALRARASAGPLTALGDNVLAVISHRGGDIHRVRDAITALGEPSA